LLTFKGNAFVGRNHFLLGMYSSSGWWYYFPVAFAVKTPIPVLLLIAGAFYYSYRKGMLVQAGPILIPASLIFGIALLTPLNIGYRHILPVLPFLFVFCSQLANLDWSKERRAVYVLGGAALWLVMSALLTCPNYLSYFNEAIGGPVRGSRILSDSNLDWG